MPRPLVLALAAVCALAPAAAAAEAPAEQPPAASRPAEPAPSPAASAAPVPRYDDPAVHFEVPATWQRVDRGDVAPPTGDDAASNDGPATVAVFALHRGEQDQRTIVVAIEPYEGTLEGFAASRTSDLRKAADGVFVDRAVETALANGMPARFLKSTSGGEIGQFQTRYDELVFDGRRGIDVAFFGRTGDFDAKAAQALFAPLSVVVYPSGRR